MEVIRTVLASDAAYVGGDPGPMREAAAELARAGEAVASLLGAFTEAVGSAADAAGEGPAGPSLARCRAVWGPALDELAGQARALSVVVAAAADDLAAAGGTP